MFHNLPINFVNVSLFTIVSPCLDNAMSACNDVTLAIELSVFVVLDSDDRQSSFTLT